MLENLNFELFVDSLKLKVTGEEFVWFNFQKTKYVYDQKEGRFKAVQFPVDRIYYHYFSSKGYISDSDIASAKQLYGNNRQVGRLGAYRWEEGLKFTLDRYDLLLHYSLTLSPATLHDPW